MQLKLMVKTTDGKEVEATFEFTTQGRFIRASSMNPAESPDLVVSSVTFEDEDENTVELDWDAMTEDSQTKADEKMWEMIEDSRNPANW